MLLSCRRRRQNFFAFTLYKAGKDWYNIQAVKHAPVAQWIEHRIPVPRVGGSSPFRRTKINKRDTLWGIPLIYLALRAGRDSKDSFATVRWIVAAAGEHYNLRSKLQRVPSAYLINGSTEHSQQERARASSVLLPGGRCGQLKCTTRHTKAFPQYGSAPCN